MVATWCKECFICVLAFVPSRICVLILLFMYNMYFSILADVVLA